MATLALITVITQLLLWDKLLSSRDTVYALCQHVIYISLPEIYLLSTEVSDIKVCARSLLVKMFASKYRSFFSDFIVTGL